MTNTNSFILDTGGQNIFCTLFEKSNNSNKTCTIIFLPLFEERMWSHRIAYNFALQSTQKDNSVLMWDYYGYGESEGDSEDFTLNQCCKDTSVIIEHLKKKYGYTKFIFLGIRIGAGISCHVLNELSEYISGLILWSPLIELKNVVYKSLRTSISTQTALFKKIVANRDTILSELVGGGKCVRENYILNNIDGYRIGSMFYQEILKYQVIDIPNTDGFPIAYLDVIPQSKETMFRQKENVIRSKFIDYSNLMYDFFADREFWLNSKDYDQFSNKLYTKTFAWLHDQGIIAG